MNTIQIPFHGTAINAVQTEAGVQIAITPVCESLGVDANGQIQRLKRQPWASTCVTHAQLPGDTQARDVTIVDRRTFTMWLATINTMRLKSEAARELLAAYQCEAADVLDKYFHEGGAINPRADEHQTNALIRQAQMQMELCQVAKGLIHPDHLEAKARIILARALGENPEIDPASRPLYVQGYLADKNLSRKQLQRIAGNFGKKVKAAYIDKHGCPPEQYPLNISNGQVKDVNAYTEADRELMDDVYYTDFAPQAVLA